ncbi:CDP-glucose 4,6-dehydratase [Polynucleobacter sp. MWH-Spelu-300-X4]|uniref:CDP-glucose 4,6-dehydratase n=1 Tax=Polynucleobacter sp. MWH-Spelu-300-X4 TaxID=2689109 RepID=UPI001BFD0912|nr:CDP-glucose 4,6-dehydratase [Polynucleobacter sp. MWH-Spelu-300-X4]QWD80038.1 CDP-glucose 4,6-dehydratase [Polynucleobacter sp. MWH-Spelu-300-X4]
MKSAKVDPQFWKDKRVFLTGHTGFKGSWLSLWLSSMGANVTGYALAPNTTPNLFDVLEIDSLIETSHIADIRDLVSLQKAMSEAKPDVVIHMAAQPLVRYSYVNPVETYATNVMGTVHVLESTRSIDSVRATVIVTTDKCYENKEWVWGYRENEPMGGYDPYSNSKGCAELVTSAYRQSYFSSSNSINKVASARAGNVIGGGDWSEDRLVPDAIKAFESNKPLMIRNPSATRPWQHVLEPLSGYLILAQAVYEQGSTFASGWNFGPRDEDNRSVQEVIDLLIFYWGSSARWQKEGLEQPHEANLLKLDCSKARAQLGWIPAWDIDLAIQKIVEWQRAYQLNENMQKVSLAQINQYMSFK